MRTLLPYDDLVNCSDATLKRLGYSFYRNQTQKVLEFEVYEPANFLVRIEDMSGAYRPGGFMGMGGGDSGNSISMIYSGRDAGTKTHFSTFVQALLQALPRKPWEGLGMISSRTSKAFWMELSKSPTPAP
ncbi:MAG TPA: hypothetical protein VJR06_05155 [Nitrososphaerales archaeon]|nr:hypothetical protein [Nitrososphaerales archaeon]